MHGKPFTVSSMSPVLPWGLGYPQYHQGPTSSCIYTLMPWPTGVRSLLSETHRISLLEGNPLSITWNQQPSSYEGGHGFQRNEELSQAHVLRSEAGTESHTVNQLLPPTQSGFSLSAVLSSLSLSFPNPVGLLTHGEVFCRQAGHWGRLTWGGPSM